MNFIRRFWKKLLCYLVTGSTSVFIAACYGMPANYGAVGPWTIRARTADNTPIADLEVQLLQYVNDQQSPNTLDIERTDSTGSTTIMITNYDKNASNRYEAHISDTDGSANQGAFSDTAIVWDGSVETVVHLRPR